MPAPPLVFLDIDGVLLPFGEGAEQVESPRLFPDRCLAALSLILQEVPTAELVLSSTWRVNAQDEIIQEFERYAAEVDARSPLGFIHAFARVTCLQTFGVRQHEIHKYLTSLPQLHAWVALDDEPLLEGRECAALRPLFEDHCAQCESHKGLTHELATTAIALLRRQMHPDPTGRSTTTTTRRNSQLTSKHDERSASASSGDRRTAASRKRMRALQ